MIREYIEAKQGRAWDDRREVPANRAPGKAPRPSSARKS